jgi:hypothetical protein
MAGLFLLFEEPPYCFHCDCTSLHSNQQHINFLLSPHPVQYLLVVFLILGILTGFKWNLSVILICISFMPRDGEHFFSLVFKKGHGIFKVNNTNICS